MIYGLGMQELLVILAIVMLLFGGKKLPEVGRNLGRAIRGFKQAEDETMKELKKAANRAKEEEAEGEEIDNDEEKVDEGAGEVKTEKPA